MISVDEALARVLSAITPLPAEMVPLSAASGRTTAAPITARLFNPAFDVSAMDGYAVRAADVAPGATLEMIGMAQAGSGFSGTIGSGQCTRIFTGAPVPQGADAVVIQEHTHADGAAIHFEQTIAPRRNIRFKGDDFAIGDVLVPAGTSLTPARLALVAAGNVDTLSVATLPRVALLATGDELVLPGSTVGPDQIVASNSTGLSAFLAPYASTVTDLGIVRDDREVLGAALAAALDAAPDILVTTGGASVGDHDYVQDMLHANGVDIDFWRIAMRPGRPLMVGRRGRTLVFGLPGNPVSALVTARLFVVPALLALVGSAPPPSFFLPLAAPLPPNGPRRHFRRGRLISDPKRGTLVEPILQTDSGHLSSLADAEVLIEQREDCLGIPALNFAQVHTFYPKC